MAVQSVTTSQVRVLRMRTDLDPWKDNRVRQAIKLCQRRDKILKLAYFGEGATGHHVYFGEDAEAVAGADTGTAGIYRGQQAADVTTYSPGPLEWGKTYYWRVDEVNPDGVATGAVWAFTTADFIIIDDFERYDNAVGSRPFEVWIDGFGFSQPEPGHPGNGSNAAVGYDIWSPDSSHYNGLLMETGATHSGYQSMPVDYNNVNSPFYSEIERNWTAAQDWTLNGVDTLTLHMRGAPSNDADRFYVTLGDSAGHTATVTVDNSDALTSIRWVEINVPLADFAGVNAAAITKMIVGLGDPAAPGGAGSLLFDDFRVTEAGQ
jgi:ABC-type transport system substrate-binding protein